MDEELRFVKQLISEGRLRDYIEGTCRVEPWQTASLRHFDAQYTYLEKHTPLIRSTPLYACTLESQNRVEVQRFAQRVHDRYTPPKLDILLLLPCSAKKPYSTSNSHQHIHHRIGKLTRYIHEVIITSPLGIVPRELELTYPAAHYDTPITGHWDREERSFVEKHLTCYLEQNNYKTIIAHVSGAYLEICEDVAEKLSREIILTAQDNILSKDSLHNLKEHIESTLTNNTPKRNTEETKKDLMRAVADYQFGAHTGTHLLPDDSIIKAPYPKHQAYHNGKQLASLIPQYGTLALTIHGAKQLASLNKYTVTIDEFKPKGTILAAGITNADPQIRQGDEVLVQNTQILAVGRAHMSGEEMIKSTRGVAIDLRHTTTK
jgi:archaeosine synthase